MAVNLNIYQTLAAAIVVYYTGVFLRAKFDVLRKYCIPAPVVGGILFAIINCIPIYSGSLAVRAGYDYAKHLYDALFHQRWLHGQHQPHQTRRGHGL
ncbi:MAG: sodium/glutamate symporter [Megasphaera sp.]